MTSLVLWVSACRKSSRGGWLGSYPLREAGNSTPSHPFKGAPSERPCGGGPVGIIVRGYPRVCLDGGRGGCLQGVVMVEVVCLLYSSRL